jgi:hypothetical protein
VFRGIERICSREFWLLLLALCVMGLPLLAGCGPGAGGPTDARLCGKWEGRKGWATTIKVEFKSNGSTTMTSSDSSGSNTKTLHASWGVVKSGSKAIKIYLNSSSKKEERIVKFIDNDHIEMKSPDGALTRLQRAGG